MSLVIDKSSIEKIMANISVNEIIGYMEEGFKAYSQGKVVVPPVGELLFENPKGEAHIKYGYIKGDGSYCIKIASGFSRNSKLGIPVSQGMMLLFNQETGENQAILLDEGILTDIRTAATGALVAKYFAPKKVTGIGVIGTGGQARLQLQYLKENYSDVPIWVLGKTKEKAYLFKSKFGENPDMYIASSSLDIGENCNLIVTTTPSEIPVLFASNIKKGTHITAVGSDTADKQELDSEILRMADIIISDSIPQSKSRGEIFQASKSGAIKAEKVIELGHAILDKRLQRTNENQISVTDLTGVAVQDIMIAKAVYSKYMNSLK